MNLPQVQSIFQKERKTGLIFLISLLSLIALTLIQDYIEAIVHDTGFYISESFLFSSYSWLFAPILFIQYRIVRKFPSINFFLKTYVILLSIAIHLLFYPLLVWVLSNLFYNHTFRYSQTLNYALSQKLYLLVIVYSGIALLYHILERISKITSLAISKKQSPVITSDTILVTDGTKKLAISFSDILFISANPPYINICLEGRKYLHSETLKEIAKQLPSETFVRIHKSTIVNIKAVTSYTSRGNGDYDLCLSNKVELRVSRNYAADFKDKFEKITQVTIV